MQDTSTSLSLLLTARSNAKKGVQELRDDISEMKKSVVSDVNAINAKAKESGGFTDQLGQHFARLRENGSQAVSSINERIRGIAWDTFKAGLIGATAGVIGFITVGVGFNSAVEQAQAKIQAFTKDAAKTQQILSYVKDEAAKTQFSFTDMAEAAAGLIPSSKSSGVALEELIKQAEILAALNPAEGLVGAAFSLKEALSGDFVSIVERFNLPRQRLNQLKEQGVPALKAIQTALNEMGIDYGLVAAQGQTAAARFDQFKDQVVQMAGEFSKPIFDGLSEGLQRISDWFNANKESIIEGMHQFWLGISAFFAAIADGDVTSDGFVGTMEQLGVAIHNLIGFVADWIAKFQAGDPVVQIITFSLAGLIATVVALNIILGIATAVTAAFGVAVAIATSPITLIALGIAAVIAVGYLLIQNWDAITAAIGTAVNWVMEKVTWLGQHFFEIIGFIIGWFASLPIKIPVYIFMAIAAIIDFLTHINWGDVLKGIGQAFVNVWNGVKDAATNAFKFITNINWGDILKNVAKGVGNSVIGLIEGAINGALSGIPGSPKVSIPRFYKGVKNFEGGLAVVGDINGRGGELVSLPRGSNVYSNQDSRDMIASAAKDSTTPSRNIEQHFTIQITIENNGGDFSEEQAADVARKIAKQVRAQGLNMAQMGELR